jgi:hypothetical protein
MQWYAGSPQTSPVITGVTKWLYETLQDELDEIYKSRVYGYIYGDYDGNLAYMLSGWMIFNIYMRQW